MAKANGIGAIVVGTGFGIFTHLRALRAAGFDVRALVGRDVAKTADRARRLEVPHACTSLADAMALDGVSVVTVATPPHTHRDVVCEAAAAGKHIVCEKPFALDIGQAREMLDAAERAGIVHMLGTEFRFGPGQALLRRVVKDGAIGRPLHALHLLHVPALVDPAEQLPDWWEDERRGGGFLGAWGVHVIDQFRAMLGEFTGVSASVQKLAPRPAMTSDDTFTIHFRMATGVQGVMMASMGIAGSPNAITRISGTDGSAWVQGDDVWIANHKGQLQVPVPKELESPPPVPFPITELIQSTTDRWHSPGNDLAPYTRLFEAFADRIAGRASSGPEVPATFADGVAAQAVMDAARLSSAEGRWVEIV
jgi:predicted dehydrogenase